MPLPNVRPVAFEPSEPLLHELPPVRFEGLVIAVRLAVRRTDDGIWRARLHFLEDSQAERITAEIFCATTEQDLWQAVRDLRNHHVRDLYRSLTREDVPMAEDPLRQLKHDLSNPLAAILTEAQLLLLNEASLDEDTVRGLREIEAVARHMRDMLQGTRGGAPEADVTSGA